MDRFRLDTIRTKYASMAYLTQEKDATYIDSIAIRCLYCYVATMAGHSVSINGSPLKPLRRWSKIMVQRYFTDWKASQLI